MTAMHDNRCGADFGCGVEILLQELSARDADPIVRGGHIEHVRSVHVQGDPGFLGGVLQPGGASLVRDLGPFPGLRVAEEELGQGRMAGLRLCYGIDLVSVAADREFAHPAGWPSAFGARAATPVRRCRSNWQRPIPAGIHAFCRLSASPWATLWCSVVIRSLW